MTDRQLERLGRIIAVHLAAELERRGTVAAGYPSRKGAEECSDGKTENEGFTGLTPTETGGGSSFSGQPGDRLLSLSPPAEKPKKRRAPRVRASTRRRRANCHRRPLILGYPSP